MITLTDAVKAAMESRLDSIHTAIPATIEKYDASKCKADVLPSLNRGTLTMPVISSVPVMFPRTKISVIHFPLVAGDSGILIFSERSLDEWLSNGGSVAPVDKRKFHLADAIFIPGLFCFSESNLAADSPDDFVVEHNTQRIVIKKSGDIEVGKESLKALVNSEFKTLFNNHKHAIPALTGTTVSGGACSIAAGYSVQKTATTLDDDIHLTKKVKAQ